MKILIKNLKKGIIKLMPLNLEDLWLLGQLINRDALVSAKTTRKIKISETKVEKKVYFLEIMVEKIEYENDVLRISGKVNSEIDDVPKGSYHSLSISVNDELKIIQNWLGFQIDKLVQATKKRMNILLVCLDRESVFFAKLEQAGYKKLSNFEGDVEKKVEGLKAGGGFYKEVAKKLDDYDKRYNFDKIVLGSPAFFKEDFMKQLNNDNLKKKILLATCSTVSESAFDELLKRDEIKTALAEERIQEELNLVEELFLEIGKEGKYVYGFDEVKEKANSGAVVVLMVTSDLIDNYRENESFKELEQIMIIVEQTKGKVIIIDSHNEAGKKLDGISGIGAILRYKSY